MNLYDKNIIEKLLKRHGFGFSKSLGQNFLIDGSVCPEMAKTAVQSGCTKVFEIGPGIGVLTKELSERFEKVLSCELDARLFPILSETLSENLNTDVYYGDVMKLDFPAFVAERLSLEQDEKIAVCANIPYNITSALIKKLTEKNSPANFLVLMVQKEVGERLCAEIGSKNAGASTVFVNIFGDCEKLLDVPKQCFMPSPKVDSEVIVIRRHKRPPYSVINEAVFERLVNAIFSMRRKTLLNCLSFKFGMSKDDAAVLLADCEIAQNERGEKLSMEKLIALSNILAKKYPC